MIYTTHKNFKLKKIIGIVLIVLLVIAFGLLGYKYQQSRQEVSLLAKQQQRQSQLQTSSVVAAVSKLIELPKSETPAVATVTDISKLKGQAFFQNAQNGDTVLIYTQAKEAILYRPSANKIINVAPVNINNK